MSFLKGKTALVTGASRGIGKAIAIDLAANGCSIAINYNSSKDDALQVLEEMDKSSDNNFILKGDVSKQEEAVAIINEANKVFGKIDILINNAGITRDSLLIRMKSSDWDEVIDTNLRGSFYCMQAAAKIMMKNRNGRIINIGSVVGLEGNPGQVNYAAAKAGLVGMTLAAAKELGSRNITVNTVAPGFIETDMTSAMDSKRVEQVTGFIPLGRLGTASDVAKLVSFLASDSASYITGQVIRVDGGIIL